MRCPIAESVAQVDLRRPAVNRSNAELALWQHLSAIGAETSSFTWVDDLELGFEHARKAVGHLHRLWEPSASGSWNRACLWNPDAPISYPDRELARQHEPVGKSLFSAARGTLGRRWHVRSTTRASLTWRESFASVANPVDVHRLTLAAVDEESVIARGAPARSNFGEGDVAEPDWLRRTRENSQFERCARTYESARYRLSTLEPLVRLWEAGVLGFWLVEYPRWRQRYCIVVPRPVLYLESGRLHRTDGPAVEWPTGASYWFLEGRRIPKRRAAQQSRRASLQVRVRMATVELREQLLEQLGYERFLDIAGAELVQQDDYGRLWQSTLKICAGKLCVVEVANSAGQKDGSSVRHYLRVPTNIRSAREAVMWTEISTPMTANLPSTHESRSGR